MDVGDLPAVCEVFRPVGAKSLQNEQALALALSLSLSLSLFLIVLSLPPRSSKCHSLLLLGLPDTILNLGMIRSRSGNDAVEVMMVKMVMRNRRKRMWGKKMDGTGLSGSLMVED